MIWFIGKPEVVHNLAADEGFEGQRGQHVQAKEKAGDVDHEIVVGEVIEQIAFCLVTKGKVAKKSHCQACNQRDSCAVMGDACEAVDCGFLQGAIDQERVVVTDKCKGYDSDSFKDAVVNND